MFPPFKGDSRGLTKPRFFTEFTLSEANVFRMTDHDVWIARSSRTMTGFIKRCRRCVSCRGFRGVP